MCEFRKENRGENISIGTMCILKYYQLVFVLLLLFFRKRIFSHF